MFKNVKGITLIALVITIIVLLILAGVSIFIANNLIIDKAVMASSQTIESSIKEKIELALAECETSWWIEKDTNKEITKSTYFQAKLKEILENTEDFSNVNILFNTDETINISLDSKNEKYTFKITADKKVSLVNLLKGNVKVGDYIEYPIEYDDIYSGKHYTSSNGWRVIDDGVMEGTSGEVRIVSTGIPAKWYYDTLSYTDNNIAIDDLVNNFENIEFYLNANENIKGNEFKVESIASKVTAMSLSDFNYAYNSISGSNRTANDITKIENNNDLFYIDNIDAYYWIATSKINDANKIYYINLGEIMEDSDSRMGIRPVVSLNENQTGNLNSNVWKIKN